MRPLAAIGAALIIACAGCASHPAARQSYFLVIDDVSSGEDRAEGLQVTHSVAIPLRHGKSYHFEDPKAPWRRVYDGRFRMNKNGQGEILFASDEGAPSGERVSEFKVFLRPENPTVTGPLYAPDDKEHRHPIYRSLTLSTSAAPRALSEMNFR
ncbi:hypothetical protein IT571_10425 [Candidatus Sumerlaeota bacterium]|nr:hypothetical protein [Candidatus Sumerlaeota bacterium]